MAPASRYRRRQNNAAVSTSAEKRVGNFGGEEVVERGVTRAERRVQTESRLPVMVVPECPLFIRPRSTVYAAGADVRACGLNCVCRLLHNIRQSLGLILRGIQCSGHIFINVVVSKRRLSVADSVW